MPEKRSSLNDFDEESQGGWIVTYADLVTLLLCFFVMLFSISSLDLQKFIQMFRGIHDSMGSPTAMVELVVPSSEEGKKEEEEKKPELDDYLAEPEEDNLLSDVQEFVEKTRLGQYIVVTREKSKITIVVEGQVFFDSGVADFNPEALPILDDITRIILDYPRYRVNIKGHTDNNPISTERFPSNWELSAVRATTVLRYLIDKGVPPRRLTATGYGERLPIAANDSERNRARNRRVEFVLEKEKEE